MIIRANRDFDRIISDRIIFQNQKMTFILFQT